MERLSSSPGTPPALPAELREAIVAGLAEILVKDYQANQGVTEPTVKAGTLLNRSQKGMSGTHSLTKVQR